MTERIVDQRVLDDVGKLVVRVMLGGLILFHGVDKILHGIEWMQRPLAALHLPFFIAYGVYLGEVVAPMFVLVGAFTRIAAATICVNMIMALTLEAGRLLFTIQSTGGWGVELEAFFLLSAVAVAISGPGGLSLSHVLFGRHRASPERLASDDD